ncbi:hypothetical protein HPP92_004279 [Vanilla planifolia]|uniref:Uncharacterized protein n=1 Tax=Vanilla planifolia TaxID=51239 RepID=A0A835RZ63_VANPL|nr:hypothetical protein HPP92_004279 [Vanilla planifolia]
METCGYGCRLYRAENRRDDKSEPRESGLRSCIRGDRPTFIAYPLRRLPNAQLKSVASYSLTKTYGSGVAVRILGGPRGITAVQ